MKLYEHRLLQLDQQRSEELEHVEHQAVVLGPIMTAAKKREIERTYQIKRRSVHLEMESRLTAAQTHHPSHLETLVAPVRYNKIVYSHTLTSYFERKGH